MGCRQKAGFNADYQEEHVFFLTTLDAFPLPALTGSIGISLRSRSTICWYFSAMVCLGSSMAVCFNDGSSHHRAEGSKKES